MKITISLLLMIGILLNVILLINGCSTVHGVGEDLDTLGRGISNHHDTPKIVQQENSRR